MAYARSTVLLVEVVPSALGATRSLVVAVVHWSPCDLAGRGPSEARAGQRPQTWHSIWLRKTLGGRPQLLARVRIGRAGEGQVVVGLTNSATPLASPRTRNGDSGRVMPRSLSSASAGRVC